MKLTIDCRDCSQQYTPRCDDCVVTFLIGREPDEAVVIDATEFAALRRLADAGLLPPLLHDAGPDGGDGPGGWLDAG